MLNFHISDNSNIPLFNRVFKFTRNFATHNTTLSLKRQGIPGCGVVYFGVTKEGQDPDTLLAADLKTLKEINKQIQEYIDLFEEEEKRKFQIKTVSTAEAKLAQIRNILGQ